MTGNARWGNKMTQIVKKYRIIIVWNALQGTILPTVSANRRALSVNLSTKPTVFVPPATLDMKLFMEAVRFPVARI